MNPDRYRALTLAIVNFKPKLIINQGTAGANDPELKVFDIVVGEATVDYDAFRSSHADAGQGIDQSRWRPIPHRLRIDGKERWVRKTYGASSEDMESAFSAGAAEGFKTPFLAIRVISDSEFHSPELEEIAGGYCAAYVVDVIRKMK